MCCHPALPLAGRVALTFKTVTGLSTREVARAFVVTEATMGKRLLRSPSKKIENAGDQLPVATGTPNRGADGRRVLSRLPVVQRGIRSDGGRDVPSRLSLEAVRLADLLTALLPVDDEVAGLHALLLLQHSRRDARVGDDGELVTMEEQDRSRWDRR